MRDVDLRGVVLQKLYEERANPGYKPKPAHFTPVIAMQEVVRISEQLFEHELVKLQVTRPLSGHAQLLSIAITARGVDVVESGRSPDININFANHQTVNVTGSSNVVVGNHNTLSIRNNVEELVKLIEASKGTPESKEEAKGLLRRLLEHPLLAAAAGGVIGLL